MPQNYRRWMHLGRSITHECLQSQSVSVLSSFKCRSVMVMFKKTWRNNISFKKGDWEDSVITSERLDTNYCKVQDRNARFYHQTCAPLEGHILNIVLQILCSRTYSKKEQIGSLYFPVSNLAVTLYFPESNLACFTNS